MARLAALIVGVVLSLLGAGLLTPRLRERFITYFDEARDSWDLPRGKTRLTAFAGGIFLIAVGVAVAMVLGGYRT